MLTLLSRLGDSLSPAATTPAESGDSLGDDSGSGRSRAQVVKDYKLAVEYKWLKRQAPGGVYVVPSPRDLRLWHGVIFVRRGMYSNGIFKFRMVLPPEYNDVGVVPRVFFLNPVFNPLVNEQTGELDVKSYFREWDPERHFVITVLTFLKKIFYMKEFGSAAPGTTPSNPEAQRLFDTDKAAFLKRVEECVRKSQEDVYSTVDGSVLRFREHKPVHEELKTKLNDAFEALAIANAPDETGPAGPKRMNVLDMIKSFKGSGEEEVLPVPPSTR